MSHTFHLPIEDRIRQRIAQGTPDVPIFEGVFRGHDVPSSPQPHTSSGTPDASGHVPQPLVSAASDIQPVVGEKSVLRGNPGRGQTPGFPHSAETPTLAVSQIRSRVFSEDPVLIRLENNSDILLTHLRTLTTQTGSDEKYAAQNALQMQGSPASQPVYASRVEIAPPHWRASVAHMTTPWEDRSRIAARFVATCLIAVLSFLFLLSSYIQLVFGWIYTQHVPTRLINLIAQFLEKIGSVQLSIVNNLWLSLVLIGDIENIIGKKFLHGGHDVVSFVHHALRKVGSAIVALCTMFVAGLRGSITGLRRRLTRQKAYGVTLGQREVAQAHSEARFVFRKQMPVLDFSFLWSKRMVGFVGQGMIISSLVIFLMTAGPIIRLQMDDWWLQSKVALTGKAEEPALRETLLDAVRKPEEVPPAEKQFQLVIPKIGANVKVIANIDAGDEKAYQESLTKGVAHAAGSGLPGEENATNRSVYIFGHSTNAAWNIEKYNALFYSLKDMVVGDTVIVWFWGKEFTYKVTNVVKVDPSDLTYLKPQLVKDQLILQTCWPPGTTWKRLLVIAEPVEKGMSEGL